MKQILFSSFLCLFLAQLIYAQKSTLLVKSSDNHLYLEHKVAPKESFFAVGRLYNVSPKFIAAFNHLGLDKGLSIDQKLRIPLTDTNFTQQGNSGTPVYYKVGDKEGLMTVSRKHHDVLLANLRSWNNLATDEVKKDALLIVGFLQSKELPTVTIKNKPKQEEPIVKPEEKPAVKTEEKPVVKAEEKPVVKVEQKPVIKEEVKTENIPEQGYFKTHFDQQVKKTPVTKNETVTAGIFKTTSGWQDAKYYLLIDKVAPGTIVRIINPTNNKAVYAKVLGEMSGIRQNEGLTIRISNAAAMALVISEQDKFIVKVNY